MTVDLSKKSLPDIRNSEKIELTLHNNINSIYFYDMTPGDVVYIDG
jgi:hypothetical protein